MISVDDVVTGLLVNAISATGRWLGTAAGAARSGRGREAEDLARPALRTESGFLIRYRAHVLEQHGKLEPPDFERRRRVPIADIIPTVIYHDSRTLSGSPRGDVTCSWPPPAQLVF